MERVVIKRGISLRGGSYGAGFILVADFYKQETPNGVCRSYSMRRFEGISLPVEVVLASKSDSQSVTGTNCGS
jgi:hypothetical protein